MVLYNILISVLVANFCCIDLLWQEDLDQIQQQHFMVFLLCTVTVIILMTKGNFLTLPFSYHHIVSAGKMRFIVLQGPHTVTFGN